MEFFTKIFTTYTVKKFLFKSPFKIIYHKFDLKMMLKQHVIYATWSNSDNVLNTYEKLKNMLTQNAYSLGDKD